MFEVSNLYELVYDKSYLFSYEDKVYFKDMNSLMLYVKQNNIVDYSVKELELKQYVS